MRARSWILFVFLLGATGATASWTAAMVQSWPERPVKILLSYGPGGATKAGRPGADKLSEAFSQLFVIENHAGAVKNCGEPEGKSQAVMHHC
jgi:tripartite-type tricarboxylate transporter receptor subunit TctC